MSRLLVAAMVVVAAAFWLPQWWLAWSTERPIADADAAAAIAALRATLNASTPTPPAATPVEGPVMASLWLDGELTASAWSSASDLAAATSDLGRQLASQRPGRESTFAHARLKLDIVTARARFIGLAIRPGVDGIVAGQTLITPDAILTAALPPAIGLPELDLRLGLDPAALGRLIRRHVPPTDAKVERARVAQFIEPGLRVEHGHSVTTPTVDAAALRRAAIDGADYLSGHLGDDGRFDYLYYVGVDQAYHEEEDAALTRHAGSSWFLALLGPDYTTATDRALAYLSTAHAPGVDAISSRDADRAGLGASALALAALSQRQTQSTPLSPSLSAWAERLTSHVLSMQRPNGDFDHVFSVAHRRPDPVPRLPYYSGEAAFGLAKRWHVATPDLQKTIADALERAIGFLIGQTASRPFVLDFIFLEDHWTCLAADAGWDALQPHTREAAARYCEDFCAFLARAQFSEAGPDSADAITRAQPDFAGAYGFSPVMAPHPTPVGSRSEALLATLAMAERRRAPPEVIARLRRSLHLGLGFLLRHQLGSPGSDYLLAAPRRAVGGFLFSDEDRVIRIDFVQHAGAALWRASAVTPTL